MFSISLDRYRGQWEAKGLNTVLRSSSYVWHFLRTFDRTAMTKMCGAEGRRTVQRNRGVKTVAQHLHGRNKIQSWNLFYPLGIKRQKVRDFL